MAKIPVARALPAVVFALLALDAWRQVVADGLIAVHEPRTLTALKVVVGSAAAAASWGSWMARRWAPAAALGWGMAIAAMMVSLEWVLGLGMQARGGLWTGALALFAFSVVAAWWIRRAVRSAEVSIRSPSGG
jgi:hypothetical protein